MASAKQIAWRKKFARMAKSGKFRKKKTGYTDAQVKKAKNLPKQRRAGEKMMKGHIFPDDDWFKEYKRLGGKTSKKQYEKNVEIFREATFDIFIFGDPSKYATRGEALNAVKRNAKIDNKELNLIFESIDNVTAYT
jgi:hypothetical protein